MLVNEFVKGYCKGDRILYVSSFNIKDKDLAVCEDNAIWFNPLWKAANDEFKEYLLSDPTLHQFRNKYFYVYEGNLRVTAWMGYIKKYYSKNHDRYISIDCILLDAHGECSMLLNAMCKPEKRNPKWLTSGLRTYGKTLVTEVRNLKTTTVNILGQKVNGIYSNPN